MAKKRKVNVEQLKRKRKKKDKLTEEQKNILFDAMKFDDEEIESDEEYLETERNIKKAIAEKRWIDALSYTMEYPNCDAKNNYIDECSKHLSEHELSIVNFTF